MADADERFHSHWLGLVQPTEGLLVSIPALVEAQCMAKVEADVIEHFINACPKRADETRAIADLARFFEDVLGHRPEAFDVGDAIPEDVSLYVPEGRQTLRPTLALRRLADELPTLAADAPISEREAARYVALVWDIPEDLDLDRPEMTTGPWEYPPDAKLDRLLRHVKVPIGILTNRRAVRLVYAPHGESSGSITFRIDDMATPGGRPILDALVMLLGANRFFSVGKNQSLPFILEDSRKRQANVTNELAEQVLDAIQILLRGLEVAAERDRSSLLREAVEAEDDQVYGGLLTVLLRLVFVLYAEDWGLLPTGSRAFAQHYSVLGLFDQLAADRGNYPDAMSRRYGAWSRLLALFRAIYLGVEHESDTDRLHLPPRRGHLFNPERFPFLEGWPASGGAPIDPSARADVRVPSIDDETVLSVLERLVVFQGQRLSYKSLDVEQLGSVYEALMGYSVRALESEAVAIRVKNKPSAARAWVELEPLLSHKPAERTSWLERDLGFDKATAKKVAAAVKDTRDPSRAAEALLDIAAGKSKDRRARYRAPAGRYVLQPGAERRRTSSHYTPRELSGPIVRRTLEPLLAVMGEAPASERILHLKICDPAMGSGAFLVEACRYLADEVVKAWTRENKLPEGDPVNIARRLVAQRCLYGVDKNAYAVDLAKLSLWLVTLARDLPFTFLDHAVRHGDSLVGLDFDQIRAGHWKPDRQLDIAELTLREALEEAIQIRQGILELANDPTPSAHREKEQQLENASDALKHARLLADLIVGAFFAHAKPKDRNAERQRRLDAFQAWKESGDLDIPAQLLDWQHQIRARIPVFHWMLEFPEVFYAERPDPLDENQVNRAAFMDAFVGNPPFAGKNSIAEQTDEGYLEWLQATHEGAHGNADLVAHFFLRTALHVGAHGTIGLIATNTIAQGDTRTTGLKKLVAEEGFTIYDATRSMTWPGDAAVSVAVVHLAKGTPATAIKTRRLDDERVPAINSRLRGSPERPDPVPLASNANLSFQGSIVLGMGFTLTPEERDALIAKNPKNAERIFPYLGGEEVNSSPTQSHDRCIISFGQMTLAEAERWADVLAIVREKVKPERDKLKNNADGRRRKQHWWQFGRWTPALFEAIADLDRCLVTARVSKHLLVSAQPTDRIFSEQLYVFALSNWSAFTVLQSRPHESWSRLLSSSLEDRLRYAATDCFETFPFTAPDPRTVIGPLEQIGARYYDARAAYMIETNQGLTQTYNRLKDPDCHDPPIEHLRRLHEEMDRAVLDAYGWTDIQVPPYATPTTDEEKKALETFEDQVIDRLFLLNAQRANEETQHRQVNPKTPTRKTVNRAGRSSRRSGPRPQTEIDFKVRGGG